MKNNREKVLSLFDQLVAEFPEIERKGKTMPYTAVNGNMFSFISPEGNLGLRLEEKERAAFIKKYSTQLMEQHGRTMKEYVVVPDEVFAKQKTMKTFFNKSFQYVKSLKPKPSKKKKT